MIKLTIPFALLVLFIMILFIPFKLLITGTWRYSIDEQGKFAKWLKSVGLV